MPNERETLKKQIDALLKSLGPGVWYRKKWGGGVHGHEGDWDWTLCVYGYFVVIEAKHPITHPELKPAQVLFGQNIKAAGGVCIEAMSVSDVRKGLQAILRLASYE